jgi:hypothetical protein
VINLNLWTNDSQVRPQASFINDTQASEVDVQDAKEICSSRGTYFVFAHIYPI